MGSPRLRKIAKIVCAGLGCPEAELSIVITDDVAIRHLNCVWRHKDKSTDVLSFAQTAGEMPVQGQGGSILLGDVVISQETAARQAARSERTFDEEIRRLLVHGILHLLGHDHVHGGRQARRMRLEEERLLRLLEERLPSEDTP